MVLVLEAALLSAAPVSAAPQTAQGETRAEIVEPLAVTTVNDLEFGGIAVPAGVGGSVNVDAASGEASYGGAAGFVCLGGSACGTRAATFAVNGEAGRGYIVTLPASARAFPVTGSGPGLIVDQLTSSSRNQPDAVLSGRLDTSGDDVLRVGGTLQIPAGTPAGSYHAEVQIVVSYD